MNKISIVITYCSLDKRFIETNILQSLKITDDVVVSTYDHLFNGDPEDLSLIDMLKDKYPMVKFVISEWSSFIPHNRYWHNMGRLRGYEKTNKDYGWIIFLDGDEILNSDGFNSLLADPTMGNVDAYIMTVNWFFREPIYRATTNEYNIPFYKKTIVSINPFDPIEERNQPLKNTSKIMGRAIYNDQILVNHYSWVRTKEEMLKKVSSWGHRHDRDWASLINKEFEGDFNGTDFVHGYDYDVVEDIYNLGTVTTRNTNSTNIEKGDVHLIVDGVQTGQSKEVEPPFLRIINKFDTIIEIGTYTGAFTKWLSLNMKDGAELYTLDITKQFFKFEQDPNIIFMEMDCFSDEGKEFIVDKITNGGKVLLLCDGGEKNREFNLFSKYLKDDDVIMLHDYMELKTTYGECSRLLNWNFPPESSYEEIKNSVISNKLYKHFFYEEFERVFWGVFTKNE